MWYHPDTSRRLAEALEIPPDRVGEALGDDVRQTWVGNNHAMEGIVHEIEGDTHTDDWGIEWIKLGHFNQIRHYPLASASPDELRSYTYPYESVDALLANMESVMVHAEHYFVGCDISPCLVEMVYRLRGMDAFFLDLAVTPELAALMIERAAGFALLLAQEATRKYKIDWLWTGDDVAGQRSMMMSPESWRELVKPLLAKLFDIARERGIWAAHHCCGALRPIIPDLIEIGMDVLNPVQCNCPGMDPIELKRDFGADLAFMGGVDTQGVLPEGSPGQVFDATRRLVEGMTVDGGGYILAASHAVPPETPLENIFAMYAAAGVTREEIFDRASSIRSEPRLRRRPTSVD
jgi:uroporphyrinogen decarboxylase